METRRPHLVAPGILIAAMLLAGSPRAYALDPSLHISQYARTTWKVRDGLFKGSINVIAQTPDGYLWLGTEFGLVRFDGVKAVPWQPSGGQALPAGPIVGLLAARDGTLWIGAVTGLASWKAGTLTKYPELADQRVSSLLEDREGTVWTGSSGRPTGKLCAIHSGRAQCYGEDDVVGGGVADLYEDKKGNLWTAVPNGLWRWKPGKPVFYPIPDQPSGVRLLGEDDDGSLVIDVKRRITRFVNGRSESSRLQEGLPDDTVWRLLRDRDGGSWVATLNRGLAHVYGGRTDLFAETDGLSGDSVRDLFEDREGNIWVATLGGLDRFRDVAVPTLTVKQGLLNPLVWSVLAARDGSLWLGTPLGLGRWHKGQISRFGDQGGMLNGLGPHSLFEDRRGRIWVSTNRELGYLDKDRFIPVRAVPAGYVLSIVEDTAGDLWISNQQRGLLRLHGEAVEEIPWAALGRQDPARSAIADPRQGGIWLGFVRGDIAHFSRGGLRVLYSATDGLGAGQIESFRFDPDGALWAATEGGLSRLKGGAIATLSSKNGLPCDTVHWSMDDDDQALWMYTACGLLRIARSELNTWAAAVEKDKHTTPGVHVTVFDSSDGVRSNLAFHGYTPRVAKTADGRLWFLPIDGVSVVDPRRLRRNELPPPVHIEQITADHATYDAARGLRLPPRVRDLQIEYTALSFVAPEKNTFRIMLEGRDSAWRDVGTRRQAFYTDLGPGTYRFRVVAANNSGVWNEAGASLEFAIAPAFYQTTWFRLTSVVSFLALVWAAHRLRVRQLARHFTTTLEARLSERTRIARELHDTLLQSFHGLLLTLKSASNLLPERPVDAKQRLDRALDLGADAIREGREAVQGLRASTLETNALANEIAGVTNELRDEASGRQSPAVEVAVHGDAHDLNPIVRDEACRIAREALRNAFRHAQARQITVQIDYQKRQFLLRVTDDGSGFDEETVRRSAAAGHFGLQGMRERAGTIGAQLNVRTTGDSGTEVELRVPGAIAYGGPAPLSSVAHAGEDDRR